jgi:ABC-type transport system involved in cytochrome c biogenesis permease subunit
VLLGLFTPLLSRRVGAAGAAAMALPVVGVAGAAAVAAHVSKRGQIEIGKALVKMIYAIICFATLFSFVGTVLGGIWADQSWGRFWGVVTSYSWFGVNMLGIGLHSYGFMDAAFKWLALFIVLQVCLIGLGSLPLSMWKSFRQGSAPAATDPGGRRTGRAAPAT